MRARLPLLLLLLAACGGAEPDPRAVVSLVELADRASAESGPALELPGASCAWFEDGLAGLRVPIVAADGHVQELPGGRLLVTWELPLPTAEIAGRASAQARLEGVPITTTIVPGVVPDPDATSGFAVGDTRLQIVHADTDELPERFAVVYPVWGAHLVGRPETDVTRSEHLFRATRVRGQRANEALVVPGGTRLLLPLPAFEAGRLTARVSALAARDPQDASAASAVRARVSLAGASRALSLVAGAEPTPFELAFDALGADARLEVVVEGDPHDLVFLEAPAIARAVRPPDTPNVLLVLIDTLRADRLRAWGGERDLAPHLDDLCDESLRFDQCWSTSSWTLPSVASMFTSTHGGQHLAWVDTNRLGEGVDTLAEVYRRTGRHTAGFTDGAFLSPHFGLNRGFDTWDAEGGGVQDVVDRARAWLDGVGDEPWFVLVHTYEVHAPYEPPKAVADAVIARHPGALLGRGPEPHRFYSLTEDGTPIPAPTAEALAELYDEELRYADRVLGGFLDGLRASGELDRTLVCLTADHGEEFGEHGLLGHGDTLYVEQLHVPLFLRFPGGAHAGQVDPRPVSAVDLAPTLLAASGLGDAASGTTFIGRSLLDDGAPSPVYAVRFHPEVGLLEALRDANTVGIRGAYFYPAPRPSKEAWQVYDLARDPAERDARGGAEDLEARLERLSQAYRQVYVEETSASPDARTHLALEKLGYIGED